jgi:hypothetical protein
MNDKFADENLGKTVSIVCDDSSFDVVMAPYLPDSPDGPSVCVLALWIVCTPSYRRSRAVLLSHVGCPYLRQSRSSYRLSFVLCRLLTPLRTQTFFRQAWFSVIFPGLKTTALLASRLRMITSNVRSECCSSILLRGHWNKADEVAIWRSAIVRTLLISRRVG